MYEKLLERPLFYNAWSLIHFTPRLNAIKQVVQGKNQPLILDLGCGTGLLKKNYPHCNYTGIDTNLYYIKYAQKRLAGRFIRGDILALEHLPIREHFDFIVLNGVLHHLDNSMAAQLLLSLGNYLHETGKIIVIDHLYTDTLNPINKILLKGDRGSFSRTETEFRTLFKLFPVVSHIGFDIKAGPVVLWKQVRFVLSYN
jgi:SAM-dependent methyltransferase